MSVNPQSKQTMTNMTVKPQQKPQLPLKQRYPSKINQVGGNGSDFRGLWYSWEVSPAELSRFTLERIDCSPMFNPLRKGTVIPTGTSGIIPAGVYLASLPPLVDTCATVECYNKQQVGLETPAQQVALQQAVAAQRAKDNLFINQLAAQEGLPQQTGVVSDNSLINSLADFMGMNRSGPQQTGSGSAAAQKGGNARNLKFLPITQTQAQAQTQAGGCCGNSGFYTGDPDQQISVTEKAARAQTAHMNRMKQQGGSCASPFLQSIAKPQCPYVVQQAALGPTTHLGPNQLQQGGTLSNGLGYSPFKGSQMTATSCANSCVPFNNTCGGRQPVYYSETESREGCTTRCRMPPGTYASSELGCRSTAFASRPGVDLGTYEDLHGTNLAASAAPLPQGCIRYSS